jgi:uncharacterized protein (TIGR02466 family)
LPIIHGLSKIMTIETHFPLAIYVEDLSEAELHQAELLKAVWELESETVERRNFEGRAWTGDIHGAAQVHCDRRFAWLVEQVEAHTRNYLQALGLDLSGVALYIQRAWPVISRLGEEVGPHSHLTAHVSAVYYVSVPFSGSDESGCLVFLNDSRQNEVSPGLGLENTELFTEWNGLNQDQVAYAPTEGRLLIFPAKQRHAVATNETDEARVSISFDILLTAKPGAAESYEFLAPSPSVWKAFGSAELLVQR